MIDKIKHEIANKMKNISIEEVGDINSDYSYLEVFLKETNNPFMEVAISSDKELSFKFYASISEIVLELSDLECIIERAKIFLPEALKNEEDYLKYYSE